MVVIIIADVRFASIQSDFQGYVSLLPFTVSCGATGAAPPR